MPVIEWFLVSLFLSLFIGIVVDSKNSYGMASVFLPLGCVAVWLVVAAFRYFALKPRKKRVKTKPTKASKEKRLEDKKRQADKKKQRKQHKF